MARAFVFASAIFWGLSGGLAGILLTRGGDPLVISYCRGAVGLVVVLVWLGIVPTDSGLSDPRMWLWSSLAGLGVAGNFTFFFISIAHGSVAVAATLMYTAPIFVYLISFVLKIEGTKKTLNDGKNYIEPDLESLISNMSNLIEKRNSLLKKNKAISFIEKNFTWKLISKKLSDLFINN